jgi:hypothetical protein
MRGEDVYTQQKAIKGWQGALLFQRGGESPGALRAGGAAAGIVFGRNQR